MDGLQWKTPIIMDDLGVPLFSETPMYKSQKGFKHFRANVITDPWGQQFVDYFAAVVFVLWTASVVYTFVGMRRTAKLHDSTTTYSTICQCIFHYNMPIDDFVYIISDFRIFTLFYHFVGKVVLFQAGALRSEAKAA